MTTKIVGILIALTLAAAVVVPTAMARSAPRRLMPPPPPPAATLDAETVKKLLAERRAMQIQRLRDFREARIFPRNRISRAVVRVFRDEDGLLCAVATLVSLDGLGALVELTALTDNTVEMGRLRGGLLLDWILASGFTQAEIAAIQVPDSPILRNPEFFSAENERIVAHLMKIERQLIANTEASLEAATRRIMNSGALLGLLALSA